MPNQSFLFEAKDTDAKIRIKNASAAFLFESFVGLIRELDESTLAVLMAAIFASAERDVVLEGLRRIKEDTDGHKLASMSKAIFLDILKQNEETETA